MRTNRVVSLAMILGAVLAGAPAAAQMSGHGPGQGMMGMGHDSATMAAMRVIHQLVMSHERIMRTVTNLPDGIRTVTESDDSSIAQLIRLHARGMEQRLADGHDLGVPMESPALRSIFVDYAKVRTTVDSTEKGVAVTQVSNDAKTVTALQQHAAEVSDLVRRGMAAMHGGRRMPP